MNFALCLLSFNWVTKLRQAMYSNTPGGNPPAATPQSCLSFANSEQTRTHTLLKIHFDIIYKIVLSQAHVVGNTQDGASINPNGKDPLGNGPINDEGWKVRLQKYSKQPETHVVGTEVIGGLFYIATKIFVSKPDELPVPPGSPGQ